MKKGIVVEGDPLSSGGIVTQGSGTMINGFKIALLGDPVSCPIPLHGGGTIIEGDPNYLDNGKPIALEGHKVSCGCTLLAKLVGNQFQIDIPDPTLTEKIEEKVNEVKNTLNEFLESPVERFCKDYNNTNDAHHLLIVIRGLICSFRNDYILDNKEQKNTSSQNEQNKIIYTPHPGTPKDLICEKNLGGAHKNTTKPPKDGYESHHMPPKSAYKGSKMYPPGAKTSKDGPAIKIIKVDHEKTQSHGNEKKAQLYNSKQKKLVQEGRFKEALQNDIDDLRKIAAEDGKPYKFECQIRQVIEYANWLDKSDFIIK